MSEPGTARVTALCDPQTGSIIAIAHVAVVEIAAAMASKLRGKFITASQYDRALRDLLSDASHQYELVQVDQRLITLAVDLTRRHKLRGYDAIHLAAGILLNASLLSRTLPPLVVITADHDQLTADQAEGLPVENPHPYR